MLHRMKQRNPHCSVGTVPVWTATSFRLRPSFCSSPPSDSRRRLLLPLLLNVVLLQRRLISQCQRPSCCCSMVDDFRLSNRPGSAGTPTRRNSCSIEQSLSRHREHRQHQQLRGSTSRVFGDAFPQVSPSTFTRTQLREHLRE